MDSLTSTAEYPVTPSLRSIMYLFIQQTQTSKFEVSECKFYRGFLRKLSAALDRAVLRTQPNKVTGYTQGVIYPQ